MSWAPASITFLCIGAKHIIAWSISQRYADGMVDNKLLVVLSRRRK